MSNTGTPKNDEEGTPEPNGKGEDGTIPNHPEGVAAGYTGGEVDLRARRGRGSARRGVVRPPGRAHAAAM